MEDGYSVYLMGLGIVSVLLVVAWVYLFLKYKKAMKEKDEKIESLHQLNTKNQTHYENKIQEEKSKILELTHTIERLETQAREGTKNQVISKIEAQQKKRARELRRAGLEVIE